MLVTMLKAKIHRATVTGADLDYEGSIALGPELRRAAGVLPFEKVEIFNCNNGERFATYVIAGNDGEVSVNGAAARLVQPGDIVIIVAYVEVEADQATSHRPVVVLVDEHNRVRERRAV
jgi:aspartate 1-decarboxylase